MSAIVDYSYYSGIYMGKEATEASFPALCARAEDVIGAMTRWRVSAENIDTYPAWAQGLYRKAICAPVDAIAINGLDSVAVRGGASGGFTVGKVTVQARVAADASAGALSAAVSPMAIASLEQTGFLGPQVDTLPEPFITDWWW